MHSYLAQNANEHSALTQDARDLRADAARKRLRECRGQSESFEVVREIVSNLLGCEEMALFEFDRRPGRPSLIWSFGLDPQHTHLPTFLPDADLARVLGGEICVQDHSANSGTADHASACVPILFKGQTAGVLVLVRMLPQKSAIDELDRGLLAVLCTEAGIPLFGHRSCAAQNAKGRDE